MTTQRRSNKPTLLAARTSIQAMATVLRASERPGIHELAHHFIDRDTTTMPMHLRHYPYLNPRHPEFPDAMATARDSAIFQLWGRSKVVYAMDEDLLGYLSQTASSAVPSQILRNLPHADPYVLLPPPDPDDERAAYYLTHLGNPWGAFVFGRYNDGRQLCSTSDERRQDLGLMFIGSLEVDGRPVVQALRCTIPLRKRMITVEDAVEATIEQFVFNEHLGEDDRQQFEGWLRTYVALILNCLLYICTDQPDVVTYRPGLNQAGKVKKQGRRQQRRPRPYDIEAIVQLGFRMGPALNAARQEWEQSQQPGSHGDGRGSVQRPHQKRGHFRTYWTGPGLQVPRVRWIAPF
jgi:hypothetical protein